MGRRKKNYAMLEAVGNRLKEAMENRGLGVSEVAKMINTSDQAIYYYLNGKREINLENAAALARILDVPVSDLLTPMQKYEQNKEKNSTVTNIDGIFVEFLKLLDFDFFVDTDRDLKVRCHVGKKRRKVLAETEVNDILKALNDYHKGNKNGISETEFKELNTKFNQYLGSIPPILTLNSEEWESMKDDIKEAVKGVVTKHIEKIELNRSRFNTLLHAMYGVLKLIDDDTKQKAIECMSGLTPAADVKEAEKYASYVVLEGFLKKYHYPD